MSLSNKVLNLASDLALKSDCRNNHAAFITKGGKILAQGYNTSRTKNGKMIKCCTHAEVSAVLNLQRLLSPSKVDKIS